MKTTYYIADKTVGEIETNMKLHHVALTRGYVSRKTAGIVREYKGKYGNGYIIDKPNFKSTQYFYREYYIETVWWVFEN